MKAILCSTAPHGRNAEVYYTHADEFNTDNFAVETLWEICEAWEEDDDRFWADDKLYYWVAELEED